MDDDDLARACADVMWGQDAASHGLGMRLVEVGAGRAVVTMTVRPDMVNGWDLCHGGYVSCLADSTFALACNTHDEVTVASGFDISFLASAHEGDVLVATAVERVRRGRSGIADVTITRGDGDAAETVAEFRGRSRSLGRPILGTGDGQDRIATPSRQ